MLALHDHDVAGLAESLRAAGFCPTHAATLLRNYYGNAGKIDFSRLNVGPRVETWVRRQFIACRSVVRRRVHGADGTLKLLVGFGDGDAVESVLMPSHRPDRAAGCVSSQVGCAMGCDFCASTKAGLARNLTAGEIVDQFLHLKAHATALDRRLTSLVFMGMGEPLHNLPNVIAAIRRIADPQMGALGWRQVTVSTVGIVPGIDALAAADLNVNLALSLHAADDATRSRIVPANRRYPVADILAAARRFADRSGRVVTIEYCLLSGTNDSGEQARLLAALLGDFRAHVNVIPYNEIGPGLSGAAYRRPPAHRIDGFVATLRAAGVVAHVRQTRGDDVSAACGQLRGRSS